MDKARTCLIILFLACFLFLGQFFAFGQEPASGQKPLTLFDCYVLALKQSEVIAIDAERLKEAEGHFLQTLGGLLPHASFSSKDMRGKPGTSANTGSERKFVFSQTLFSGFKEFAAMSGSHLERDQFAYEKARAEQLLFIDVADAFYLLMEVREDLKALETIKRALKERIRELMEREKLGRSRRSEVVNTEAQLFSAEADYELLKNEEVLVRQLLEFLTGKQVGNIVDTEVVPSFARPETDYTSRADSRPDVQAAQKAWELAKKNVIVARSGFFPTISLEGNRYMQRSLSSFGGNYPVWDATLKVDVPIFQGTETIGAVKAASSQARQAEMKLKRARRSAVQDIRNAYVSFESALLRNKALEHALSAAEMNYILQKKDYRYNLVNNIAVLDAIQSWQEARRKYVHGHYKSKRAYWQLRVASGETLL